MCNGKALVGAIRHALLAAGYVLVEKPAREPVAEDASWEEFEPVGT
jgi:hypothetical protein